MPVSSFHAIHAAPSPCPGSRTWRGGVSAALPSQGPATPSGEHREWAGGHPAPPAVLRRALTAWTRLHGALSLELAGHFTGMRFDPELYFAGELHELLTR
ncbi:TetR-like C-terminal domain-containing protein [Nonomuraea candida]|uniref:TetR-like C-terminal domain-containing protein n=1 Tax=Nonomuraea candida TaxID=359159 RepID=UPI000694F45E|nr:TetR-like C-terminal domain-containing protein [Nonomuraea candida]